tara:strand:+ start:306 stop:1226 length:921 start_codon:yes stop_codon:yes gene_type:complete
MAQRAEALRSGRFYLPTINLTDPTTSFGNITPAFNNNYDVSINFHKAKGGLKAFIDKHGFYDEQDAGSYLALFCSEAVLPGSDIQTAQVDGLRQGLSQKYATFRRFPDVILTYYSQTDYFTNDVFNAWMEYISPTSSRSKDNAFRRMKYPNTYKCDMEITAFSKDTNDDFSKLNKTSRFNLKLPSSITYKLKNVFPSSIVAAPLAYGRAELIKTTITFKYDQYFVDRSSRRGAILQESRDSDRIVKSIPKDNRKDVNADSIEDLFSGTTTVDGFGDEEFLIFDGSQPIEGVDINSGEWYVPDIKPE